MRKEITRAAPKREEKMHGKCQTAGPSIGTSLARALFICSSSGAGVHYNITQLSAMDVFSEQKEKLTKDLNESTVEYVSKVEAIKAEYIEKSNRLQTKFRCEILQKEVAHLNHVKQLTGTLKENEQAQMTALQQELDQIRKSCLLPPQVTRVARPPMAMPSGAPPPVAAQTHMAPRVPRRPGFATQADTSFTHTH